MRYLFKQKPLDPLLAGPTTQWPRPLGGRLGLAVQSTVDLEPRTVRKGEREGNQSRGSWSHLNGDPA